MPAAPVPNNLQPYFDKGLQAYTQGSYAYAVDVLTYVIKHAPDATEARRYLRLAIQKLSTQQPPSWLMQLAVVLAGLPVRLWALLCALQGRTAQAIQLYERLLCRQPRSRGLLLQLADALRRAGLEDDGALDLVDAPGLHGRDLVEARPCGNPLRPDLLPAPGREDHLGVPADDLLRLRHPPRGQGLGLVLGEEILAPGDFYQF